MTWFEIVHVATNIGCPNLKFEDYDEACECAARKNMFGGDYRVARVVDGERIEDDLPEDQ